MDAAGIYKVCTFFFIELFQIWDVLEIVCIKFAALYNLVWSYIVIKYCNFQVISFFFKKWFCFFKDLCMRCCGCCNCDCLIIIFCINACA